MIKYILILLSLSVACFAQDDFTESQVLFDETDMLFVEITMPPDSFAWLLAEENLDNDRYLLASVRLLNTQIDTTIDSVGFRVRGNTSRQAAKKSFKISFDAFIDRHVLGLKKMNINGEHNDPSVTRSKLCWDLLNDLAAPGSRAAHCRLYVNSEYRGLYMHVEEYDKTFLRGRFISDEGNLYKCLWPADLGWRGSDPEEYKFENNGRRAYELQTNEAADDYTNLAHFIGILHQTSDAAFVDSLEAVFDSWTFLKTLATEVAVGQWDNYWYNKNNYFLYDDPATGKFVFMPYDLDNTFGIFWEGIEPGADWGNRHVYNWGSNEDRPLSDRMLTVPQYRNLYGYFLQLLIDETFTPTEMFARMDSILAHIQTAAEEDIFRTLDYDWSYEDFLDSYNIALGEHVPYGLRPYVIARRISANNQLQIGTIEPVFRHAPSVALSFTPLQLNAAATLFDDGLLDNVRFHIVLEQSEIVVPLEFEGDVDEGIIPLERWTAAIPLTNPGAMIRYYFDAEDFDGNRSTWPRGAPETTLEFHLTGLLINEFLAANDTTNADEFGEFDDWIELYNGSDSPVSLAGWSLSDDASEPDKWLLPDTTVATGGFILLWADDDEEQGALHGTFNLNRDGEFLGLYFEQAVVDTFRFGDQEDDISYGRIPDGGAEWEALTPTPGTSNLPVSVGNPLPTAHNFSLEQNFPNPFNPATEIRFSLPLASRVQLHVYDITGRLAKTLIDADLNAGEHGATFDASSLPSGVYFYRLTAADFSATKKMVLMK